jgi:hypothetical protein
MHNRRVSSRPSIGVYWLLAVTAALTVPSVLFYALKVSNPRAVTAAV